MGQRMPGLPELPEGYFWKGGKIFEGTPGGGSFFGVSGGNRPLRPEEQAQLLFHTQAPEFTPLFDRSQEDVVRQEIAALPDIESPVLQRIQQAREQIMGEQAGRTAEAQGQLARRGGLTGGAAERLAQQGQRTAAQGAQDIQRQGLLAQLEAGQQEGARAERGIQAIMGARQQDAGQRQALNQFNQSRFQQQMALQGAAMEAQAVRDQKKK